MSTELEAEVAALRARIAGLEAAVARAEETKEELRASQEMLQLVLDTIPQCVWWKDRDSVFVGCNQNFARAAGLEHVAEIVGKTDYDLPWKREEADFFRECDRRVMERDTPEFHIVEPQSRADGKLAWLDTNKVPLHDASGKVVGTLGTFEDISERIEAQHALAASEENLRITLASIGDAVIATDGEGQVTRMNRVAESLTGWSQEEAVGQPLESVFQVVNAHTREPCRDPVAQILSEGQPVALSNGTVLIARDASERQIADRGAPIRSAEGEVVGVVLVFRDVTDEHEVAEQLRQSQKLESVGQLAGGIAHDFNNALTGILGATELLARSLPPGERYAQAIGIIGDAARAASELTQKLLAFSRKGAIKRMPLDAHRSIGAAVDLLRSVEKSLQIEHEAGAEHSIVLGDDSQLQHAILNLGINARDAMGGSGRLSVRTDNVVLEVAEPPVEAGLYLEITVEDEGHGIPAEHLGRIFEPFFTTKPVGEGTGLGLAAVYGAVARHQGRVQVFSEVGQGTQFKLLLPVVRDAHVPSDIAPVALPRAQGKVLVVDDERIVQLVSEGLLKLLGCEVLLASSGEEALEIYASRTSEIDLVLLDMVMPGVSGRDVFLRLRALDPAAKVLFMSGYSRNARVEDVLEQGALGFLKKPFALEDLSLAIGEHLHREG